MSEAVFGQAESTRARQIKARAAAWLEQREREDWCEQDQAGLDAWLAESSAHMVAYLRLEATWDRAARLVVLRNAASDAAEDAPRRNFRSLFASFAAVLIAVAIIGAGSIAYVLWPVEKIYSTALGEHQTVKLADGSKIELNTSTTLRTVMDARHRTVWLDHGEAFFQIAHDTRHPFIVMVGDHRVTVLGTKFLVRRDTSHLEVAVVEGRVRFDPADGQPSPQSALLGSGDVVVAPASATLIARKSTRELTEELGWRRGVLIFDNTTLADAATEFNRYNREQIIVAGPVAQRMKIDGTFRANDVAAFTRLAQAVLGLHVENRGDLAVISR